MRLLVDYDADIARSDEPYKIYQDGKYLETGITDNAGQVFTNKRHLRTEEEFVIRWLDGSEYVVYINNKWEKEIRKIHSSYYYDNIPYNTCQWYDCSGTGFLWIEVYWQDENDSSLYFRDSTWRVQYGSGSYTWVFDNRFSYIPDIHKPTQKTPSIVFTLCDGTKYDIWIGNWANDTKTTLLPKWVPISECPNAIKNQLWNHTLNSWAPYIRIWWKKWLTPLQKNIEINKVAENTKNDLQIKYDAYVENLLKNDHWVRPTDCRWALLGIYHVSELLLPKKSDNLVLTVTPLWWWKRLRYADTLNHINRIWNIEYTTVPSYSSSNEINPIICTLKDNHYINNNDWIIILDWNEQSDEQIQKFINHSIIQVDGLLDVSIAHIRATHYFYFTEFNIPNITGGIFLFPLEKEK
jgi:hypothetical protein